MKTKPNKNATPIVCTSCRTLKKKCDGGTPCRRCIEKGIEHACEQVVPKKRGRRSREEVSNQNKREREKKKFHIWKVAAAAAAAASAGCESSSSSSSSGPMVVTSPDTSIASVDAVSGLVDMILPANQATMLSLLMAYSNQALAERPGDIISCFGLESLQNGYIAVSFPSNANMFKDLRSAMLNSYVVSCGHSASPRFPDVVFDPSYMVGKRLMDLGPCNEQHMERMASVLLSPPPVPGKPWIRRIRFRKQIISQFNRLEDVVLEETLFMDGETRMPRWIFCTLLDRVRSVRALMSVFFHVFALTVVCLQEPKPLEYANAPAFTEVRTEVVMMNHQDTTSSGESEPVEELAPAKRAREEFRSFAGQSAELLLGRSALLASGEQLFIFDHDATGDFRGLEAHRHESFFDFSL
jgi:hypothetical protein